MPFLLLLWPFLEIWLFIRVCAWIGTGDTVLLCILSALAGAWLIQRHGIGAFAQQMRDRQRGGPSSLDQASPSSTPLFDRVCMALAGGLLILPGFLSDLAALALLTPGGRQWARRHTVVRPFAMGGFHAKTQDHAPYTAQAPGDVIEGDYERLDDDADTKDSRP